jgi:DNA-directed RNA polymerase beta subunit
MSKKTTASPYVLPQKTFSKYRKPLAEIPNLIENHVNSYNAFLQKGFGDILNAAGCVPWTPPDFEKKESKSEEAEEN